MKDFFAQAAKRSGGMAVLFRSFLSSESDEV
jgi:hypothetical protein